MSGRKLKKRMDIDDVPVLWFWTVVTILPIIAIFLKLDGASSPLIMLITIGVVFTEASVLLTAHHIIVDGIDWHPLRYIKNGFLDMYFERE